MLLEIIIRTKSASYRNTNMFVSFSIGLLQMCQMDTIIQPNTNLLILNTAQILRIRTAKMSAWHSICVTSRLGK